MRFILSFFFCLGFLPPLMAAELDIAGGMEYFQWEEFSDSGSTYLDETGLRQFVEVTGRDQLSYDWVVDFGLRLYSGTVDYDGETLSGKPVKTDTDYNGARAEIGYSRNVTAGETTEDGAMDIRFALGVDKWRRGLQDTTLPGGIPVIGYVERYTSIYARLGATYRTCFSLGAGVKAPLYTSEKLDIGGNSITLHPEGQLSLFANLEVPVAEHWLASLSYDSYRFAKSDNEDGYEQPKSTQDTLGMAIHYHF